MGWGRPREEQIRAEQSREAWLARRLVQVQVLVLVLVVHSIEVEAHAGV